jgi:hypothetical protein
LELHAGGGGPAAKERAKELKKAQAKRQSEKIDKAEKAAQKREDMQKGLWIRM